MPIDLGTEHDVTWTTATSQSVTVQVIRPDGETIDPAVTTTGVDHTATVPTTIAGRYLVTWTNTTSDEVYTDTFEVWPADPRFLISIDDAMDSLQWRDGDRAAKRDMLRLYVAAATPVIEDIVGAVIVRTIVQHANGGKTGVVLWERPSEITEVQVDGQTITDYVADLSAAIVYRGRHGERFLPGKQIVRITYKTGSESVSPNIQLATRELVRHLWQIGQQITTGTAVSYGDRPQGLALTPSGFAVPKRVIELCAGTYKLPGIA